MTFASRWSPWMVTGSLLINHSDWRLKINTVPFNLCYQWLMGNRPMNYQRNIFIPRFNLTVVFWIEVNIRCHYGLKLNSAVPYLALSGG